MVFADLFFLYVFLPVCLLFYFISKNLTYRNIILIVFSLIFYAWGEPEYIILLIISAVVNYFCGILTDKNRETPKAKIYLAIALIINFGMLGVFKYTGFFIENINNWFNTSIASPKIALPIGISFYTFQATSYIVDCYWGKVKPQRNFAKFLMYISLFPQLVAGPIVRYNNVAKAIDNRQTTKDDISYGATRIIFGLAKKVIISNNLSSIVAVFLGSAIEDTSVLGAWYGAIIFALQVYFDFSGYSDIAIGLGRIFGFKFNENFKYPFASKTISEFWQRWHISLGTFFRDYLLYIPIFGRRLEYVSLFLVWFCTGFWHGANWNFIIWGLYFGVFICIENLIGKKRLRKIPKVILHIYSKIVLIIGFGIFYFEDLGQLGHFFKSLVGANSNVFCDRVLTASLTNNIVLIVFAILFSMPVLSKFKEYMSKTTTRRNILSVIITVANIVLLSLSSIMLVNATNNPFLYFRW
ncbi:MAG: MBOAT family protein [Clostridiales bacterium]|nr:MBOAT family protein [Clostridiales bacterium]